MPASLDRLFNPRSIAVVGASNNVGKLGNAFMRRLGDSYGGRLHAVNPVEREVADVPAVANLDRIDESIDLLIALLPGDRLIALLEDCRPGCVDYLLAIPSGFAEVSPYGRAQQERMAALAREKSIRIVGPNVAGIMNAAHGLNASLMPFLPPGGVGLSCVTQSGGFGMLMSMYALDRGMPIAKFCDLGNMSDLKVHEVLSYYASDPETKAIGLFLETVTDGAEFLRELKAAAQIKPVIFTGVGLQWAGRLASLAHIGHATGVESIVSEIPSSVLRVSTSAQLLNAANALARNPRTNSNRAAILTGTGGIGAELADLAALAGFAVPEFSSALKAQVGALLPYYAGTRNPVDLTPIWAEFPTVYPTVLQSIADSGEVDVIVVSIMDVATAMPELVTALVAWRSSHPEQAIVVFWGARDQDCAGMRALEASGIPCFRTTRETVEAAWSLVVQ